MNIALIILAALRFLFIGDSITDGGWGRSGGSDAPSEQRNHTDQNHIYGHSYMMLCAARWQSDHAERGDQFFNRGISGNTLQQLEERWEQDALALHPDVVTILIGTNDVSDHLKKHPNDSVDFNYEAWGEKYRRLLDRLRCQNPEVSLVLCKPFVGRTGNIGKSADYDRRKQMVKGCGKVVEEIGHDYNAAVLDFFTMFDKLTADSTMASHWIWDGIHPTPAGHQRMADMWLNALQHNIMPTSSLPNTVPMEKQERMLVEKNAISL